MSGKIKTIPVWSVYTHGINGTSCANLPQKLNKTDTYISIFGASQNQILDAFQKVKEINILHMSKKSVNGREGHGTDPRNTVVVYELA